MSAGNSDARRRLGAGVSIKGESMKRFIAIALIGVFAATLAMDADAQRRLGGGRNLGQQSPQVQQRQATPPQQTAPQAGMAAARPSPFKGALLGLAAGLGLAALASYFGFSETLTAILMALLIALVVMAVIGFVVRRMRGGAPQPAYSGAGGRAPPTYAPETRPAPLPAPAQRANLGAAAAGARPG